MLAAGPPMGPRPWIPGGPPETDPPVGPAPAGREAGPVEAAPVSAAVPGPAVPGPGVPEPAVHRTSWAQALRSRPGEVRAAARLTLALLLTGIPIGVIWWLIAPRRAYRVAADGAFAVVGESEAAVGTDGWLMVLTAVAGLLAGSLVWWRATHRGPGLPVALAVGMALSGTVASIVGGLLGHGPSAAQLAEIGNTVYGPLVLRAQAVLVVGPFLAVSAYLLAVCFTGNDDLSRGPGSRRRGGQDPAVREPEPGPPAAALGPVPDRPGSEVSWPSAGR